MSGPVLAHSNLLLGSLRPQDLALLTPHLERLPLVRGQHFAAVGEPVTYVWFPEGGVGSITLNTQDGGKTEVGIFGREGMSATCAIMGVDISPYDSFLQVDGTTALRMEATMLKAAFEMSSTLRRRLLQYAACYTFQMATSAASNAQQRLEARLARWLLMCHDRTDGDELLLTHEFMAMMIAAERSGVTVSLHVLEGVGAIRSKRGRVIMRDRRILEDMAGDCYGRSEAEYSRLIAPFGKSSTVDYV